MSQEQKKEYFVLLSKVYEAMTILRHSIRIGDDLHLAAQNWMNSIDRLYIFYELNSDGSNFVSKAKEIIDGYNLFVECQKKNDKSGMSDSFNKTMQTLLEEIRLNGINNLQNIGEVVYLSYASSDAKNPRIDDIEKRLENLFKLCDIPFEVYKNSNEKHISDFEKNIGKAKIVVIILTDKYFKSSHCMNEWTLIHIDTRGKKIIYVKNDDEEIKLDNKHVLKNGYNFDDSKYLNSINEHWEKQRKAYDKIDRNVSQPTEVQISDSRHNFYREEFITINNYLRNISYYKTSALCEFVVLDDIKNYIFNK